MPPALLNYVIYQIGWLAAVLGAGRDAPWIGTLVALGLVGIHLALVRQRQDELRLVVVAGGLGAVVDSVQMSAGLLTFPTGALVSWVCPPWIVVLWMQFATTLRFGLWWLVRRPLPASVLGALAGPLAYYIGAHLDAVVLGPPQVTALLSIGVAWAVALPILATVARSRPAGRYRHVRLRIKK